jgi:D-alanyl-D-alanine dipeptidase
MRCMSFLLVLLSLSACQNEIVRTGDTRPTNAFVSIADVDPSIMLEIRYHTANNFVGTRIRGYDAPKCLLTWPAARALANAQQDARQYGLSLKVYDCYRPQRAVDHFAAWAQDTRDIRMRRQYYPAINKENLFDLGYIAARSGHSRGSTVDVTLVAIPPHEPTKYAIALGERDCRGPKDQRYPDNSIDMGTDFDCFDPLAHTANASVPTQARYNRLLLKSLMEKHGFVNLPQEWWHYTLGSEPFPDRFFDFPVY